ncbi:hypothetical protein G6F46_014907 [Rhizopus delemar]|nr:hypothetical protein G6F46_014907 [Rhizopus delemar]
MEVGGPFAGSATAGRILPAMYSSHGFRTAPIPSGWVQTGERWALWYNGRPEDVADQGSARGQRPAGEALRRALVRGQALSVSAPS